MKRCIYINSSLNSFHLGFSVSSWLLRGFLGSASDKKPACQCRRQKRAGFNPWVRKIPWRRAWQLTPVFLPGESHRQRTLWFTGSQRVRHTWSDLALTYAWFWMEQNLPSPNILLCYKDYLELVIFKSNRCRRSSKIKVEVILL